MTPHTLRPRRLFLPRPLVLAVGAALAAASVAQRLPEAPAGMVSIDVVQKKDAELKTTRDALQAAQEKIRQLNARPAADAEAAARLQQAQADLAEARKRIAALEAQVRDAERQRDDAMAAAKRAQAAVRPAADPDSALRAERDRLKAELARAVEDKGRLQTDLAQAQQALRARPAAAVGSGIAAGAGSSGAPETLSPAPAARTALANGQELTIPGCGAACPSFIVLPQAGRVKMGIGSEAVTVDFPYRIAMGKTEVTVAQWKHFMADSNYRLPHNNETFCDWEREAVSDQHPVRCVSAEDADAYARWFQSKYARQLHPQAQVRLPTSDEWEYAARAGRWTQEHQWDVGVGKETCALASTPYCGGDTPDRVAKQGRSPNAWGLYDLVGNVWEATSTESGRARVVRGGSFNYGGSSLRLSARGINAPGSRSDMFGFRLLARIDS